MIKSITSEKNYGLSVMNSLPRGRETADQSFLVNLSDLIADYYRLIPNAAITEERVKFGTSGHRGSSFEKTFNEQHILAISQAICLYRSFKQIDGPLFLGMDTHALSAPALNTTLEVLAANGVEIMIAESDLYTPTPAVSHAILGYNQARSSGFADGIVITPSHNPPHEGGFKYDPPTGGSADETVTDWIEAKANQYLEAGMKGVKRVSLETALRAPTTHRHDYIGSYTEDLINVLDMNSIRDAGIHIGVDPLGGAGVNYWHRIAEIYGVNLTVINDTIDASFGFVTPDSDGKIRTDPSSPYTMRTLVGRKEDFDLSFACDADHDRHGIVTPTDGLIPPNHYLSVAVDYLFRNRPGWLKPAAIGKTIVSSQMIDLVAAKLDRKLHEVPVGFKWFVDGLLEGSLNFGGEESAGATFARLDGSVWTTDKDGIVSALLAAEITAATGRNPGENYRNLTDEFGESHYARLDARATPQQRSRIGKLAAKDVKSPDLAGHPIRTILSHAPGNGAPIGGIKVIAEHGWFAARPSGTENIYKIYAESFKGPEHLNEIVTDARSIVDESIGEVEQEPMSEAAGI